MRDRNGKLFSSGNGEDAGSNPALTQKKTEEQTRKNGVHRSRKGCMEKTVEGKERQRWNRSSKASGMRVSEQGCGRKDVKL